MGGGAFEWATKEEERRRLWQARHGTYYAALALRPGSRGIVTDAAVPISKLAAVMGLASRSGDGAELAAAWDGQHETVYAIADCVCQRHMQSALSNDSSSPSGGRRARPRGRRRPPPRPPRPRRARAGAAGSRRALPS